MNEETANNLNLILDYLYNDDGKLISTNEIWELFKTDNYVTGTGNIKDLIKQLITDKNVEQVKDMQDNFYKITTQGKFFIKEKDGYKGILEKEYELAESLNFAKSYTKKTFRQGQISLFFSAIALLLSVISIIVTLFANKSK